MKAWLTAAELSRMPGMPNTERGINKMGERGDIKRRKRQVGKGWEYHIESLPITTQAAIVKQHGPQPQQPATAATHGAQRATPAASSPSPASAATFSYDSEALWAWASQRPARAREEGARRAELLHNIARLMQHGRSFRDAAVAVGQAHGVSAGTLRNWWYGSSGKGGSSGKIGAQAFKPTDWAAALIPGYAGRTSTAECSPEAWDFFRADYLRQEKPAATACYDRLKRAANEHGWAVPSLDTLERRIAREFSRAAIILARHGNEALKRSFPAQKRDHGVFHALEAVNADGHRFDVFVKWPDGEIARPNMIAWQDIYSGKLLSYRIDKTENTDAVRLAFGELVERYGIPSHCYLDNGRAFASKWMTGGVPNRYRFKVREEEPAGILTMLGVEVHWATPYHGQAKPIERAFRDLCEYVARHPAFAGAYTGNNPMAKPENYGSKAIALADFLKILDTELAAHNARQGRRSDICNGRSFDEVFAESYARSPIHKATAEQRRLWLLAAEGVKVRRDGSITLAAERENRYWTQALHNYAGHNIVVRFDPQALHDLVHCYTMDGRYIAEAQCIKAAGFNDTQAAREHSRIRNQFRRSARDLINAEMRMTALQAAKYIPAGTQPDDPETRVVRPAFTLRSTPTPTLNNEEQAAVAAFNATFNDSAAQVITTDDPSRNYERWLRIDARIARGEDVSDDERRRWESYQRTDEFDSMKGFYDDFGLGGSTAEA